MTPVQSNITINVNCLSLDRLFGGAQAIVEKARFMEDAGVDGIVMPDHVVFGTNVKYPFGLKYSYGSWKVKPEDTWPEPMAVLTAAAAATRKVDLVTNVLIAPLRSATVLAKQVATLFQISEGRFQLGVGTGWQKEEYMASGQSFEQRSDILFDQMGACRSLWYEKPATFSSKHVSFEKMWCSPGLPDPRQKPMPLWFGIAPIAGNARFFAEFDGDWSSIHPQPDFIANGLGVLQEALRERYGITRALRVRAAPTVVFDSNGIADLERTIDSIGASVRAGVTEFDFPVIFMVSDPSKFDPFIKALARIERRRSAYL